MNKIIFITGGARSGKSIFAESLAKRIHDKINNNKIAYIATSAVTDDEFKKRIEEHKKRRGIIFQTYEEEIFINELINKILSKHNIFIFECLATWLGNIFFNNKINELEIQNKTNHEIFNIIKTIKNNCSNNIETEILNNISKQTEFNMKKFLEKINPKDKILIIISNETGSGIVPDNFQARLFRDILGNINKNIALNADLVFNTISGIPVLIKYKKE